MQQSKDTKLFIVIRHGERMDLAGLVPLFGKFDPELTPNGVQQAFDAGVLLSKKINEMGYSLESTKINVTTSPFLRTIQTGREFIKGINSTKLFSLPNQIGLDSRFSEIIYQCFYFSNYPKDFLHVLHPQQSFEEEVKGFELKKLSSFDLLPEKDEEDEDHKKRIEVFIKEKVKEISKAEYEVTLLIVHGAPIVEINRALNGPGPYDYYAPRYCEMFFYEVKDSEAKYIMKITPYK